MVKKQILVLGAGNMGTVVAKVIAENGHKVNIWNWEKDIAPLNQIEQFSENKKYLPGIKLPQIITPVYDLVESVKESSVIFFVLSTKGFSSTIEKCVNYIQPGTVMVVLSKGIEAEGLCLKHEILEKNINKSLKNNIVVVSGPAVASQMANKQPTFMNIASKQKAAANIVCKILENSYLRLKKHDDMIGLEVAGSFKNVYSIGLGIADGLGLSLNAKAALLTSALEEIAKLIKFFGGKEKTAYTLSGIGDLVGTAFAIESRNRRFGEYIGRGFTIHEALEKIDQVVEGLDTLECLSIILKKKKIKLVLAENIIKIVKKEKKFPNIKEKLLTNI